MIFELTHTAFQKTLLIWKQCNGFMSKSITENIRL